MEFDSLGKHCEHKTCQQKDFLPFKCDKCHKNLCFLHRSEFAHDCDKKGKNDMTSLDCPICKKSFKLSQADDPNLAWEQHFASSCTQEPGKDGPPRQVCASPRCFTVLGPSNNFKCPKCHRAVCLSCRLPESHQCAGLGYRRGQDAVSVARVNKLSKKSDEGKIAKNPNSSLSSSKTGKKGSIKSTANGENTLKGSAQRRMQVSQEQHSTHVGYAAPPNESFDCPICFKIHSTSEELIEHVNSMHSQSPHNTMSNSVADSEVCPTCSRRFPDIASLIQHAERDHSQGEDTGKCGVS